MTEQQFVTTQNDITIDFAQSGNVITIMSDGSIVRGPGFTTNDEAALEFWAAVEQLRSKKEPA